MKKLPFLSVILRYTLGVFFILSALLKINDPLGLQYKIDEYFDVFHLLAFKNFSFSMAIVMNALEFIIGVALLMNTYITLMKWLMLALLAFFTFLTAFAYFSGHLKECGCLGNCVPITAGVSFVKDIVLMVLASVFCYTAPKSSELLSTPKKIIFYSLIFFPFLAQLYIYFFMPVWDCMPFRVHTHIPTAIEQYQNNKPKTQMFFVYTKNNQEVRFDADKFPADFDSTYVFVRREDILVETGKKEGIADFIFTNIATGEDVSSALLTQDTVRLILLLNDNAFRWLERKIVNNKLLLLDNSHVYIVFYNKEKIINFLSTHGISLAQGLLVDNVLLKTMCRSPITIFTLQKGTIVDKKGTMF